MSGFDVQTWQNAKVMGGDEPPPEPGTYYATVEDATVFTSSAGEDYIRMGYRIVGGADDGYTWSMLGGSFNNETATAIAKTHCARLGIDVNQVNALEELDESLKACVGRSYEITVKDNGEFRNVYVNRDVSDEVGESDIPTPEMEPAPVGADDEDPIPF
jgi:hypothetical protein